MATLASVNYSSHFIDNSTTYNGNPIEWVVTGKDLDGTNITTLIPATSIIGRKAYDVKESSNPNTRAQTGGNGTYAVSNILQWLNKSEGAGDWYVAQHEYDQAPLTTADGDTYANDPAFLSGFGEVLLDAMQEVEKMGVTRKVHLPGWKEVGGSTALTINTTCTLDEGLNYRYNFLANNRKTPEGSILRAYVRSIPKDSTIDIVANSYYTTSSGSTGVYVTDSSACGTYIYNIVPIIFVNSNIPVTLVDGKYYLAYGLSTPYSDYGSHKLGFDFVVNLNSGDGAQATLNVYAEGNLIKTTTIDANKDVTVTLEDSEVSGLATGLQTITLTAIQNTVSATTSFTYTKAEDSAPNVLLKEIGSVTEAFTTTYQVYDDGGDSVDVTIKLNDTVIGNVTGAEQKVDLPITVTSEQFDALSYGEHTISVIATDGTNTTTKTETFIKCSQPSVSIQTEVGTVTAPFSINVDISNNDGSTVTTKVYIDDKEVTV